MSKCHMCHLILENVAVVIYNARDHDIYYSYTWNK